MGGVSSRRNVRQTPVPWLYCLPVKNVIIRVFAFRLCLDVVCLQFFWGGVGWCVSVCVCSGTVVSQTWEKQYCLLEMKICRVDVLTTLWRKVIGKMTSHDHKNSMFCVLLADIINRPRFLPRKRDTRRNLWFMVKSQLLTRFDSVTIATDSELKLPGFLEGAGVLSPLSWC